MTGFVAAATATANAGDAIDETSAKIGISAKSYQEWDYVMGQCGMDVNMLQTGMKTLSNAAYDNKDAFEKLGISQDELKSMSTEELFDKTISQLSDMEAGTERTALATDLFGKSATDMMPMLNMGSQGIADMRKQAEDYGMVMSDDAVKASGEFADSIATMQGAMTGLKNRMMAEFLPSLTKVTDGLTVLFTGDTSGIDSINEGIGEFVDEISSAIPQIMEIGGSILGSLAQAIMDNLPTLIAAASDLVITLANGIIENLPMIIETGLTILLTLADSISDSLPELIPTIVDVVIQIVETLIDNVDMLVDASISIIMALATGLINALPELIAKAPEIVQKLVSAVIENAPKLLEAAAELIMQIVTGITNNLQSIWNAAIDIVNKLLDGVKSMYTSLEDAGKDIINKVWEGLKSAWDNVASWFTGAWNSLFGNNTVNVTANTGTSGASGSHASGLPYVPYDGYAAQLHRGETVLNASDTSSLLSRLDSLISSGSSGGDQTINLQIDLDGEAIATKTVKLINKKSKSYGRAVLA